MRYLAFIFILIVNNLVAQTRFNINTSIGIDTTIDVGGRVIETSKHQFLSCGVSNHPDINYQAAYLVKTDSFGNLIWKKQYDITVGGADFFMDLVELPDNNYLVTGITTDPGPDDDDVFLAKIDTAGNLLWKKQYTYPENDQSRSMRLTPDGKVIIVGNTFTTGNRDGLLIKTDLNGDLIWRKAITNTSGFDEIYYNVDVIKNNNEYILGGMKGYYNTGNSYFDLSLMRTDTAGIFLWQQEYGTLADETGNGGVSTLDSGYVLCGAYNGQGAIIKIDKQGTWDWFKNYNLSSSSVINQVIQLPDSGFALITSSNDFTNTNTTGFLIRTDKNGNMLWKRIYPHPPTTPNIANYFMGFNTTADKGFIITGQYNHIGQPYQNMWLVKTDSLGCDSVGGCSYLPTNIVSSSVVENSFNVYPNPANDVLNIEFSHPEFVSGSQEMLKQVKHKVLFKITNALGEVVSSSVVENTQNFTLKTHNLVSGIYFVSLYDGARLLGTKKIIRQ